MFSRYWRDFPWGFQVVQYLVLIFLFATLFMQAIAPILVPVLTGIEKVVPAAEAKSAAQIDSLVWYQVLFTVGIFGLPAVVFAHLTHPRPLQYLQAVKPRQPLHWLLIAGLMIGALPLFTGFGELMRKIDLGPEANKMYAENQAHFEKLLDFRDGSRLLWMLAVTALTPAVCEELMFRGIMMRFARQRTRGMGVPIALTATLFAFVHIGNPYALVPVLAAGVLLGLVFYWTGSILCSMWAHFLFDGVQVVLVYLATQSPTLKRFAESDTLPLPVVAIGAALFALCFYLLWKTRRPLPSDWFRDFTTAEADARLRELESRRRP